MAQAKSNYGSNVLGAVIVIAVAEIFWLAFSEKAEEFRHDVEFRDRISFWIALLFLPFYMSTAFFGLFFVANRHRRQRMGVLGVAHFIASSAAIVGSRYLQLFYNRSTHPPPEKIHLIHAWVCVVAAVTTFFMIWMVPVVSKRYQRVFAIIMVNTVTLSLAQLTSVYATIGGEDSMALKLSFLAYFAFAMITVPLNLVNQFDCWSTFTLNLTQRTFVVPQLDENSSTDKARSSAWVKKPNERMFWRAFRKADVVKQICPVTTGKRISNFQVDKEHPLIRASHLSWIALSTLEMSVPLTPCLPLLGVFFGATSTPPWTIFTIYSNPAFWLTMTLKGRISTNVTRCLWSVTVLEIFLTLLIEVREVIFAVIGCGVLGLLFSLYALMNSKPLLEEGEMETIPAFVQTEEEGSEKED